MRCTRFAGASAQGFALSTIPRVIIFRASRAELLVMSYGCDAGLRNMDCNGIKLTYTDLRPLQGPGQFCGN